ncbi:MAG TPA: hypothetical protein PLS49_01730 [Candidatus Woesebacteria bacterium]|nr:hypothetical protein [Candidatus Woesebacteria bacterium]
MKQHINLLSITFTKRRLLEVAGDFRMKALIVLIILILIGVGEFTISLYLKNETKKYELSKNTLEQYVDTNQEFENNIKHFFYKYGLLKKYLAEDANGYIFYEKVRSLISEVSTTAQITTFTYKNNGETNFTIEFPSYEEAEGFISSLETPLFLDVFEYVSMQGFDASDKASTEFSINITAQFLQENENGLQTN